MFLSEAQKDLLEELQEEEEWVEINSLCHQSLFKLLRKGLVEVRPAGQKEHTKLGHKRYEALLTSEGRNLACQWLRERIASGQPARVSEPSGAV